VAGFLGVSNLLDGRVDRVSDGRAEVVLADGTRVGVPANPAELSAGKDVTIGVRPEKLRIGPTDGDGAADLNTLEGSVIDASYVGVSTQYVVRVGDGHEMTAYAQNVETSGLSDQLSAGERVRLTWKPQHTFVIPRREESSAEEE